MQAMIMKIEDSGAVFIPMPLLELVGLSDGDKALVSVQGDSLVIRKPRSDYEHKTLQQRIDECDDCPENYLGIVEYDDLAFGDEVFW